MSVKRIDRTKQLMQDLEKSASASVKEAAIMLKVIAREMVSLRYTDPSGTPAAKLRNHDAVMAEIRELSRRDAARKHFTSLPDTGRRAARIADAFQKRLDRARMKARS